MSASTQPKASAHVRLGRSHKKSRLGCQKCKERKVKCDEKHPICGNCSRSFGTLEPCRFDDPTPRSRVPSAPAPAPAIESSPEEPPLPLSLYRPVTSQPRDNIRSLELKLFHHYTSVYAHTIPWYGQKQLELFWVEHVPQVCFVSDAVLSSILALAAIHWLSLYPEDNTMKLAAQYHLGHTIKQHSQLVLNLNKENAEPTLLSASMLIAIMRNRFSYLRNDEPYNLPIPWFYVAHGASTLHNKLVPFLEGATNVLMVRSVVLTQVVPVDLFTGCLPRVIEQDSTALLEGLEAENSDPRTITTYRSAVSFLHTVYIFLLQDENLRLIRNPIYSMPGKIPKGFINLLEQKDPRAMAILARVMALLKLSESDRYIHRGTAEYEVQGIAGLMPASWQWAMKWPFRILRLDKLADCELDNYEQYRSTLESSEVN